MGHRTAVTGRGQIGYQQAVQQISILEDRDRARGFHSTFSTIVALNSHSAGYTPAPKEDMPVEAPDELQRGKVKSFCCDPAARH